MLMQEDLNFLGQPRWPFAPMLHRPQVFRANLACANFAGENVGSRDGVLRFVPNVDLVENMKRWVDDLRICEIIEGAGHWIQQERVSEVNALLLRFLATLK